MGYLLLNCPHCLAALVLSDVAMGRSCICPTCREVSPVPEPAIRFPCPSCRCTLQAPEYLRKGTFMCPNCEVKIQVPQNSEVICPSCQVYIEVEESYYREVVGKTVKCPKCRSDVSVPVPGAEPVVAHSVDTGTGGEKRLVAPLAPKTLKLDKFLAGIPQAHSLQEGRCPYCNGDLEKTCENAYMCRRCNRLMRAVEPSVRRA